MDGDGDLDFDDIDDFVSLLGPGANRAAQTTQAHTSVRRQRTLRMPIAMSSGSELRGAARDARAAPDVTTDPAAVAAQRVDTFYTRLGRALSRRERHPDLVSVKQVTRRAVQREILPSVEYQLGYDTRFLG
ncbi:MAG: hypothetical protein A2W31_02125 [Planctomycetes bacterium RBG_16_64_10]|nr:MAG: hypothetical protein A2W31_02125 [Planctomycetes bacterium RBG_16_64_10]